MDCYAQKKMQYTFGEYKTSIFISRELPGAEKIVCDLGLNNKNDFKPLFVCDENTSFIAEKIIADKIFKLDDTPCCKLKSGEENKNWQAVESILSAAQKAKLGRDGIFIAVGGGAVCDLCAFAASVYKRGCGLVLIPTSLLAMADASIGGKTGFDLFGIKNLIGSFYPAQIVYMPLDCLTSLPAAEWKSGMAEIIKTAVLAGDDFFDELNQLRSFQNTTFDFNTHTEILRSCIEKAVLYKCGIVSEDLRESGRRMILNLGHTFAHALEASAGLGNITHGEAVAWGIVRSCALGLTLGVTPRGRAEKISALIKSFGYNTDIAGNKDTILRAMQNDKKKKNGKLTFIVPDENSARSVTLESETEIQIVEKIITGEYVI